MDVQTTSGDANAVGNLRHGGEMRENARAHAGGATQQRETSESVAGRLTGNNAIVTTETTGVIATGADADISANRGRNEHSQQENVSSNDNSHKEPHLNNRETSSSVPMKPVQSSNFHIQSFNFTPEEYEAILKDQPKRPTSQLTTTSTTPLQWTEPKTRLLCDIVAQFDVRWPIILDRIQTHAPWREILGAFSLVDLKERYYTIGQKLVKHRAMKIQQAGGEDAKKVTRTLQDHTIFKHAFNAQKERERQEQLEKLFQLSLPEKLELNDIENKLHTIQRLKREKELQKDRRKESNSIINTWIKEKEERVKIEYKSVQSAENAITTTTTKESEQGATEKAVEGATETNTERSSLQSLLPELKLSSAPTEIFHVNPFIDRLMELPNQATFYTRSAVLHGLPLDRSTPNDMPHKIRDELEQCGLDTRCFLNDIVEPGQQDDDEPIQVFTANIHDEFEVLRIRTQYLVLLKEHLQVLEEKDRVRDEGKAKDTTDNSGAKEPAQKKRKTAGDV